MEAGGGLPANLSTIMDLGQEQVDQDSNDYRLKILDVIKEGHLKMKKIIKSVSISM